MDGGFAVSVPSGCGGLAASLSSAFALQREGSAFWPCRRGKLFSLTWGVFLVLLLTAAWRLLTDRNRSGKLRIPSGKFWRMAALSESFWNREQQRLDLLHNPMVKFPEAGPPEWLRDTGAADPCRPDYRARTQVPDYNLLPPIFQDFLLHMRCRNYTLLMDQPHLCRERPFLLLVVKSLVPHFERRQAIRQTWGRAGTVANRTVATVFLLGNAMLEDHYPDLQDLLRHEAALHRDLLQWDYRDTFLNLTLKEVLFLDWFARRCPQARFLLKGDDDVLVNTLLVIDFLEGRLSEAQLASQDLFVGDVIRNAEPCRDPKLKYYVPLSVFDGDYPPYAGGGGYLLAGEVALRLHRVSQRVLLFPIDDVYTGMCLRKLGLVPLRHAAFRTLGRGDDFRTNPCIHRGFMVVHSRTPEEMLQLWPWMVDPHRSCQ